jgi:uncharacterized membrane protein
MAGLSPSFKSVSAPGGGHRIYNQLAGTSLDRLGGISDGIFSVGMTLLVLGLAVPSANLVKTESDLLRAFQDLLPSLVTYFMSFLTLGIFWVGQQTQMGQLARSNRNYTWLQLAFLLAVTLMPFSTQLLAHFIGLRLALLEYWFNLLMLGLLLLLSLEYGLHAKLFREDDPSIAGSLRRRILIAQSLYAAAAALCLFSTYLSIALIVLIQLNYALAPRIPLLHRF